MNYGSLQMKREVTRPARCKVGTRVTIHDIHPDDKLFDRREEFIGKDAFVEIVNNNKMYARTEAFYCGTRKTYIECYLRIVGGDRVKFKAVRFARWIPSSATLFYQQKTAERSANLT